MEYRTCEQYVLGELEAEQEENARLRSIVAELERERDEALAKKAESPDGDVKARNLASLLRSNMRNVLPVMRFRALSGVFKPMELVVSAQNYDDLFDKYIDLCRAAGIVRNELEEARA